MSQISASPGNYIVMECELFEIWPKNVDCKTVEMNIKSYEAII